MPPGIAINDEPDELRWDAGTAEMLGPDIPFTDIVLHAVGTFGERAVLGRWRGSKPPVIISYPSWLGRNRRQSKAEYVVFLAGCGRTSGRSIDHQERAKPARKDEFIRVIVTCSILAARSCPSPFTRAILAPGWLHGTGHE